MVTDGYVHMLTTRGLERVDVLYRRLDDDFLDPEVFRPDSMLGVPGLIGVYKAGRVAWPTRPAPALPTTRSSTPTCPQIIKYYTGEEPILPNVPTYICGDDADRAYVLDHLDELVVKAANESGGYGMLVGPHSTRPNAPTLPRRSRPSRATTSPSRRSRSRGCRPSSVIASRAVMSICGPMCSTARRSYVQPGGLTRVALDGVAGGQLLPGRRQQGHLGAGGFLDR